MTITRHYIAGLKVLLPALALGLTHGLIVLSIYLMVTPDRGYGPGALGSFLAVTLAAWGCGAWWWGKAIDGESSLAPRMLALTQTLAALFWLAWPWLLPFSTWLGSILYPWNRPEPGPAMFLGQAAAMLPLLAPAVFFCGGTLPLLAEMGMKKRRQLEWNLPLIGSLWLAGLSAGAAAAAFLPVERNQLLWCALAANFIIALIILLTGGKPESDGYGGPSRMRLWPSRALGLWSGDAINVLDHDLTKTAARPAWLVTFLTSLTITGYLSLWTTHFGLIGVMTGYDSLKLWWVYLPAAMALGGLIISPQLSRLGSPSSVLAMIGFLSALGLLAVPRLLGYTSFTVSPHALTGLPEFWLFIWPCAILGALWPLAGQVFQSRRHWLASSLGLASFWCGLGGAAGLILTGSGLMLFHQAAVLYTILGLLAAFLGLTPLIGRLPAFLFWGLASGALMLLIQPATLQPDYLSQRAAKGVAEGPLRFYSQGPEIDLSVFETSGDEKTCLNGRPLSMSRHDLTVAAMIADAFMEIHHPGNRDKSSLAPVLAFDSLGLDGLDLARFGRLVTAAGPAAAYRGYDGKARQAGKNLIVDDPRHYLSVSREEYALIISGPLDDTLGTRHLRGRDFYLLADKHLMKRGLMIQLIDLDVLEPAEIKSEMKEMSAVFSQVSFWNPGGRLAMLLATPGWEPDPEAWLTEANLDKWRTLSEKESLNPVKDIPAAFILSPQHLNGY
ncbi:hypothetical protein C4J81_11260 [Deltaproteobacteria bacterium Smac51]|nr:hypothetical protein C4J81_11260 [Deltaproteobacteria bacterium Smac51]